MSHLLKRTPSTAEISPECFLLAGAPAPALGDETLGQVSNRLFSQAIEGARALLEAWPLILAGLGVVCMAFVALLLYRRYRRAQQEQRFGTFFEAAPGALLLLDLQRRVLEANQEACRLLGRPLSALRGRRLEDFLEESGAQSQSASAAFEAIHPSQRGSGEEEEGGGDARAETDVRIERPDGTARQVRMRLQALSVIERRRIAVTLQDMTSLSEEHSFFKFFHRRTLQDLPIELAVLSPEGTYLYANPLACTDEISPQWLQGKSDFDLCRRLGLHPEVALRRRSHRRRALKRGERVQFKEVLSRRDAPPRHVERFYTPIFEEGAEVHAVVTYALDRTKLRNREESIEKLRRESQDFEDLKTTLLRNLRHEFRTPLTSILGVAEVLREDVPEEQRDFVDILHHNGQRLLRTLNAVLDLAGTRTGSLDQKPRVLNLEEAVENVIEELEETVREKGLFLRKQVLASEAWVRVDPASLYRVLRSIIGNAVKFTDEGGVVVEVAEGAGQVEVRVLDTGIGIDEEALPQLFEEFKQEDGSMTRHFEGTGVGLAVARRLLDLMGGTVSVDSEKGEGSVFTISLPRALRDASGQRLRLLVAEEQEAQERLLGHRLESLTDLTFAHTLDEALETARRERFAVVLVSAGLSPEDAAGDLVDQFRSLPGYEHIPLIVIDESALPGAAEQFEADGYDGYVARPLKREALLNTLGDVLAERSASGVKAAVEEKKRRRSKAVTRS